MKVKIREHPAYLPVLPLDQHHPDNPAPQPLNRLGLVAHPVNGNTPAELLHNPVRNTPRSLHQVLLLHLRPGMPQPGGKVPVVGKDDKPRGPVVQAAHVVKPLPDVRGQEVLRQGPSLGIKGTAEVLRGLVQGQVMPGRLQPHRNPVHPHLVLRAGPLTQHPDFLPIDLYPALQDEFLRGPPGGHPRAGQINLEAHPRRGRFPLSFRQAQTGPARFRLIWGDPQCFPNGKT